MEIGECPCPGRSPQVTLVAGPYGEEELLRVPSVIASRSYSLELHETPTPELVWIPLTTGNT